MMWKRPSLHALCSVGRRRPCPIIILMTRIVTAASQKRPRRQQQETPCILLMLISLTVHRGHSRANGRAN